MKRTILALAIGLAFNSAQAQNYESGQSRHLKQTGVNTAWARNYTGTGVTVAVIDQGFDINNVDLKSQVRAAVNFTGSGSVVTPGTHGTAMASIVAGARNNIGTVGVAPGAKLLLAQVGSGGSNLTINQTAVASALNWASQNNASIINLSFGAEFPKGYSSAVSWDSKQNVYYGPTIQQLNINDFKVATARGSILVFAAGNQGLMFPQSPANFAVRTDSTGQLVLGGRALIVGSVDATNVIASFSNRAGHLCANSVEYGNMINIYRGCFDRIKTMEYFVVAPGVNILASQTSVLGINLIPGGVTAVSGTSASAAYVSGGLAVMKQAWPHLRPEQLVNLLLATAKDLGPAGIDPIYGRGLVDFDAATRPQGTVRVASIKQPLGTGVVTGTNLVGSAIGGGITTVLRASTVLSNTQVLDEIGRNYTADLTKSMFGKSFSYDALSPYMGYVGYMPVTLNFGSSQLTVLSGQNGTAFNIAHNFGQLALNYQFGSQQESRGFVGNYGAGALDLGSSLTNWHMIGIDYGLTEKWRVGINYGQGTTQIQNSLDSVIAITKPVYTDTWRLGFTGRDLIIDKDQFSFGLATDVRIKSGQARITAVTGYEFEENAQGDIQGRPIVSKELVDLKQSHNTVLWTDYRVLLDQNRRLSVSASANQFGYRAGVNLTWIQ